MYRVLFYIDELTAGGAEKVLCNLVNNMDPSSFDITVHTTYKSDTNNLKNSSNIHYRYVYEKKTKLNRLLYRIEAQLGLFYQLHLKGKYDIEVAYLECGPTKVMASSTNRKAVHMAWIHCDLSKKFLDMNRFAQETSKYYKKYDQVVCVSEDCNQTYQKYFSECAPSQVVRNVIDAEEIKRKAEEELNLDLYKDRLTLVAVGRQSYEKNYSMLLRIHKQLIEEGCDHALWLIGEGPETEKLKQYVNDNNINNSVRFFGFQSNPYPIMKAADVLVSSSIYEGYSTVINEALILGLPVITTDCSGMREILGDNEFGIITENNEKSLKSGLYSLIINNELRADLKEKSMLRAAQITGKAAAEHNENLFIKLAERISR